jgi:hypothetical protein
MCRNHKEADCVAVGTDTASHTSVCIPVENGLKQLDALTPLLFNFALECAIGTSK